MEQNNNEWYLEISPENQEQAKKIDSMIGDIKNHFISHDVTVGEEVAVLYTLIFGNVKLLKKGLQEVYEDDVEQIDKGFLLSVPVLLASMKEDLESLTEPDTNSHSHKVH